jgi:hypothetical protein
MLKELVKVANRLDSLGLTKEADLLDQIVKMAVNNNDNNPESRIQYYKSQDGKQAWGRLGHAADFYSMAKEYPEAQDIKDTHYSDWSTDDFKKVIFSVDGRDEFAESFGEKEAERIGNMVGYTELDPNTVLTPEEIAELLDGHFDDYSGYVMSKNLLDKIISVNIRVSDLEDADKKYFRVIKLNQ